MPFNTLILNCLIHKTSHTEKGKTVSVKRGSDETVLFFLTDNKSNKDCMFYQNFIKQGQICDLVIYYANNNKKSVCFVELKGTDIKDAVSQISNTYHQFKKFLELSSKDKQVSKQIEWKSYILEHGGSPKNTKEAGKRLQDIFQKGNFKIESAHSSDIGNFIRG